MAEMRRDLKVISRGGMKGCASSCRSPSGSLPTSVLARSLSGSHTFNNSHGAVGGNEGLVGDATDIGFVYLVEIVHLVEKLAPIAIARLIQGKVRSQTLVAVKTAQQISLGSGPD